MPADEASQDWSRPTARALFQAALEEPAYTGKVYYLVGRGGIGKSHELRLIHRQAQALRDAAPGELLETGIVDLAHTRYQQPLLLLGTLARRLTRSLTGKAGTPGHFASFFHEAERYLNAGGDAGEQAASLEHVRERFLEDYRAATAGRRAVITIDTFERLDPRIPEVEQYNFRSLARLEAWLIGLLDALPNSVTFIAGRVRPRQTEALQQRLAAKLAAVVTLPRLGPQEVRDILEREDVPEQGRDLDWYERMYEVSGGLPVQLIVATEIARACDFDPDHLPPSLSGEGPVDREQLGHDFADAFVGALQNTDPQLGQLIELACYLRKGLHAEQVQAIVGGELATVQELLAKLSHFGFVKVSGDGLLTLHDDVYDLLEEQLGVGSADGWRAQSIDFLVRAQAALKTEIAREGLSIERLGKLRTYQVDRLYYQFAREPTLWGYQNYCELAYSAIFARDEEFDTQLQDELARFYDPDSQSGQAYRRKLAQGDYPWERICYDEAMRWAFRRIHARDAPQGGYQAGIELAARIADDYKGLLEADSLARCALDTVRLEAEGFLAAGDELDATMEHYAALVETLLAIETVATADMLADGRPIHQYRRLQARFLRAYALNNWGYLARRRFRLHTAIERYTEAIEIYRSLGDETNVLRATSLNNLGNALRLQGDLELALFCINEAILINRQAGARYREAIGYNTRAFLYLNLDNVLAAQHSASHARALLKDFAGTRNAALIAENHGAITRRLAVLAQDDPERSLKLYQEAIAYYEQFREFFDRSGSDQLRRIEARQGLGSIYRSLAQARGRWGEDGSAEMERARALFREARTLLGAGDKLSYVDLAEDIAYTFVLERRYAEALEELNSLDELAKSDPVIQEFVNRPGATESRVTREQRGFWLQLSKVELQRGICHLALGNPEETCLRLLRSFAFVLRYSPESPQLRIYREAIADNLLRRYRATSEGAAELGALRQRAYLVAQRFNLREAFFKLERVFDTAEQMLKLL